MCASLPGPRQFPTCMPNVICTAAPPWETVCQHGQLRQSSGRRADKDLHCWLYECTVTQMEHEYFTVKLHSVDVDPSMRIRLETRFAQHVEWLLEGHEAALLACKRAAAKVQEDSALKQACTQATDAMRQSNELPTDARFSISLSQVIDL